MEDLIDMSESKNRVYDIGAVALDDDKNAYVQLHLDRKLCNAIKLYGEVDKSVMRSICLPPSHQYHAESLANQSNCSVVVNNTLVDVRANLNKMMAYKSDNSAQGSGKWVGLLFDTGVSDITTLKYNGAALTAADVAEAALVGGSAGMFVLWIKAEEVAETPKVITISGDSYPTKSMKVVVTNVSSCGDC